MSLRIFRLFFPGWRASTWKCAPAQHLWSPVSFSLQQSGTSDPLFGPTRDVFFNERKNHHYLLFPNKKNFYVRPKITLNSHLLCNSKLHRLHYMRPNLRAGAVFIWPWQSAPNITRASGYLLNRAVFFVLLLVLTSLLFKKPFHVQFKPSRVSKTTMHCVYNDQAEVVCQFTANSTPGWSCLPIQLQPGCTTTL